MHRLLKKRPYLWEAAAYVFLVLALLVLAARPPIPQTFRQTNLRHLPKVIHHTLTSRSNTGNDAIPNWLGHPDSYLEGPYATLETKAQAVVTGQTLICALNADASSPLFQQSPWTDTSAITNPALYGWRYSRVQATDDFMQGYNLNAAFAALGISNAGSDWYQISTSHFSTGRADGKVYPPTEATYTNVVNLKDGAIIAATNYGPGYTNERYGLGIEEGEMVPLRHWSDLFFLALQKTIDDLHTGSVGDIEHVFRYNIQSSEVQAMLATVTGGSSGLDFPGEWPGLTYPIKEYQAKAALSVANGKGVAHLLGTHKVQMGIRVVDRINVFNCKTDDDDHWCMYFHIVDGPLAVDDM